MQQMKTQASTSAPLRVLHIGKYYPPFHGGMEHFLGDLLPALARRGIAPAALVHQHRCYPKEVVMETASALPIFRVPCYGQLLYAPLSPQFPFWLARKIKAFRPDILHFHLPNTSAFWAMMLPQARRLPWLVHWHSDVVGSQIDWRLSVAYPFYRPIERKMLALSAGIVATSPPYLESSPALQAWRSKCQVIPLGMEPARMPIPEEESERWAEKKWGECALKILSVGRMTYYKGHEFLLAALKGKPNIRLILVGEGERRNKMEQLVKALAIENQVQLVGSQSAQQLAALMASCDCLCLPSIERTEAFGVVLLEAMRLGKAVIATEIPGSGVAWVVQQGQTGFLVRPADAQALAKVFTKILGNKALLTEKGHAGQRRFEALFHIDQVVDRLIPLYQQLVAERGKH